MPYSFLWVCKDKAGRRDRCYRIMDKIYKKTLWRIWIFVLLLPCGCLVGVPAVLKSGRPDGAKRIYSLL